MKAISLSAVLPFLTSLASALPSDMELFGRAVGGACTGTEGRGTCQHTSNCRGISYPQPFCPNDPDDVQCCVEISCQVGQKTGFCRSVANNGCPGGTFDPGNYCPGSQDIQCCLPGGGENGDVGARVLAKAKTAAGVPYAWGGGSCSGPSHDQPPYQYGETGYDCSGLVAWAVCQVTGRNLFAAGLRVTYSMYCASDSRLAQYGMKKYPVGQRKAGDAVFFGGACSCSDPQKIHHVGLVMENTNNMWNAPNDEINKVTTGSIVNYGESPCPYVVRFT